jgi:hypothetical protein
MPSSLKHQKDRMTSEVNNEFEAKYNDRVGKIREVNLTDSARLALKRGRKANHQRFRE